MKIAHKHIDENGSVIYQSIIDHSNNVSKIAGNFAKSFKASSLAEYSGMMHDVGKYSNAFQHRINGKDIRVDHSTAGAQLAWNSGSLAGKLAAFCIGGHHSGLPDIGTKFSSAEEGTMFGKIKRKVEPFSDYKDEINPDLPKMPDWMAKNPSGFDLYFLIKMVFSSLVDADYLDTEHFVTHGKINREMGEPISSLLSKLKSYLDNFSQDNVLNLVRTAIRDNVVDKADSKRNLYSLTIKTGGGKTLTSLLFALKHAVANNMERIIYVIPYTSIIEQTQEVFEKIFGSDNVLAHYADAVYEKDENDVMSIKHLATENWDAPIIITTAVQFFESIYANGTSKNRKLHNIANSVIVFDEAQMLPYHLLYPCTLAIIQLVKYYNCTSILCTATQPSLTPIINDLDNSIVVTELCEKSLSNHPVFNRVTFKFIGHLMNDELINNLSKLHQVLCVVNSRKEAQKLYEMLPIEGRYHLSTTMTSSHRTKIINTIKNRLKQGLVCRVISTSLIEAGVDIDFPIVYREMAGMDSIVQCGGRCNREGKADSSKSIVYIYESECRLPFFLRQNYSSTHRIIERFTDISSEEAMKAYYDFLLYSLKGKENLDRNDILKMVKELNFKKVSEAFKMIEGSDCTIFFRTDENIHLLEELIETGPNRKLLRILGKDSVGMYKNQFNDLVQKGIVDQVGDNFGIIWDETYYSDEVGLVLNNNDNECYIV